MNKSRRDQEKLLAEVFHGDWSAGVAADFASQAAAVARRRQRSKRMLLVIGATAGMAAALLLALRDPSVFPKGTRASSAAKPAYEIISDEDFLAQLKDRPLLVLPTENGAREFVLLED